MAKVEIDEGSGFCFGVVTAIHKAEEELAKGETLYCLGDIVHNSREVDRLKTMGLITINREEFKKLRNAKVLLRAHGEPPETYIIARENNIEIIDATCPVVLRLQKRIKQEFLENEHPEKQIVIYGKTGHAEVLGLVGRLPAPNVRTDYAGQKAGGYPRDVLLPWRLVYLHYRFINLQHREAGRQAAANRTHQATAVARQRHNQKYQPLKQTAIWKKYRRMRTARPYRRRTGSRKRKINPNGNLPRSRCSSAGK